MTTIVAMEAKEGIVLCADPQVTIYDEEDNPTNKLLEYSKILSGPHFAMAFTGQVEEKYIKIIFDYLKKPRRHNFQAFYHKVTGERLPTGLMTAWGLLTSNMMRGSTRFSQLSDGRKKDASTLEQAFLELKDRDESKDDELSDLEKALRELAVAMDSNLSHPVDRAVSTEYFVEVDVYNAGSYRRTQSSEGKLEWILATQSPQVQMFRVDEDGWLHSPQQKKPAPYIAIGSGAELAEEYFTSEKFLSDKHIKRTYQVNGKKQPLSTVLETHKKLPLEAAYWLSLGAMRHAGSQDLPTGLHPYVALVEKDEVRDLTPILVKKLDTAVMNAYQQALDSRGKQ